MLSAQALAPVFSELPGIILKRTGRSRNKLRCGRLSGGARPWGLVGKESLEVRLANYLPSLDDCRTTDKGVKGTASLPEHLLAVACRCARVPLALSLH